MHLLHAFYSIVSHQWFITIHPMPYICHSSRLNAPNVDKNNNSGSCATLHFQPFCCLPLVSTCICLFNEGRRLLASGLLNGHLFFMPVSLHSSTLWPPSPLQAASRATCHMTSARMKSDGRPGKRRANWWNWLNRRWRCRPRSFGSFIQINNNKWREFVIGRGLRGGMCAKFILKKQKTKTKKRSKRAQFEGIKGH